MDQKTPSPLTGNDPRAAALYGILRDPMGVDDAAIDAGVPRIVCSKSSCKPGIEEQTAGDGLLQPGEIYEAAIRLLEAEEDAFAASGGKALRPFTELVSAKTDFRVPWLFNDFDPTTNADDRQLLSVAAVIDAKKQQLAKAKLKPGTRAYNRALAEKLTDWILAPQGGGAIPWGTAGREYSVLDYLALPAKARMGDCSELSRLGYAIYRLAGLKTSFVDVQKDRLNPAITSHMATGLKLDPSAPERMTTVDLYHYGDFSERGHTLQAEMPAISAMAIFANNTAIDLIDENRPTTTEYLEAIDSRFQAALVYDPFYAITRYNYAIYLSRIRGDAARGYEEAKQALELRPFDRDFIKKEKELRPLPAAVKK